MSTTNIIILFGIIVVIMLVVPLSVTIIILHYITKLITRKNEIMEKNILYNTPLKFEDLDVLDKIINDEFDLYQIMHLAHRDNLYINPEMQQQIITDILKSVLDKISEDLYKKLQLFYDKDHIDDLIFNKIKLVVINYTIEINGNYKK